MNYSINISYFLKSMDMKDAAHIVAKAGFRLLDYTPMVSNENWKSEMYENLEIFAKEGLSVHQTHAPGNRYNTFGENFMMCFERAFEASKIMNAEYMVVHGDEFDFYNNDFSIEKGISYNYELFAPFVDRADRLNIAFENVFPDCYTPKKYRLCSEAEELRELIEKFNSDNVCCCWDFGHAHVAFGKEQPEKIRYMDKYIKCTHVHDSQWEQDTHLPLFLGDIDWCACTEAMRDINYAGNLSLEFVYGKIPRATSESFVINSYDSVRYLSNLIM